MSSSTLLNITDISSTQSNKHTTHNNAVAALEQAANRRFTNASVGAGPYSVSEANFTRNVMFEFSGEAGAFTVKFPSTVNSNNTERVFVVKNSGTHTMTVQATTGSGATATLSAGEVKTLYQNHEDVYVVGTAATSAPYDLGVFIPGQPDDASIVMQFRAVRAFTMPDDFAGSYGYCNTNPSATATFTVKLNGSNIGTIAISTGGTFTFLTSGAGVTVAAGDRLTITAPTPADSLLADVSINLIGMR